MALLSVLILHRRFQAICKTTSDLASFWNASDLTQFDGALLINELAFDSIKHHCALLYCVHGPRYRTNLKGINTNTSQSNNDIGDTSYGRSVKMQGYVHPRRHVGRSTPLLHAVERNFPISGSRRGFRTLMMASVRFSQASRISSSIHLSS
jgi:hypothetical protein